MTLPPIFGEEYYAHGRDVEARHWWNAGMRDVATEIINLAQLPATGQMLDIGCGSGQGMHWFARLRPRWNVAGLDLGMDGLRAAKMIGLRAVVLGTGVSLPVADSAIDVVITLDMLQHLPLDGGDNEALHEIRRVLKPRGHLFIRTNVQSFPRENDDPEAVWHKYDAGELEEKLGAAGFSVIRLSRINAILGLAEIPRAIRQARWSRERFSYEAAIAAPTSTGGLANKIKRGVLRFEGRAVRAGVRLPVGRSLVALCRRD
ncbi:MAG: class I SAM-dependent methyltransferase [Gemmatimonadaceae bacterium]